MKCEYCGKQVSILNPFFRKHGKATEWSKYTGKIKKIDIVFCSKKCFEDSQKPEEVYV